MDLSAVQGDRHGVASSQDSSPAAQSLVVHNEMTIGDWWFAGLDQRLFTVGNVRWTTRVLGVHSDGFRTWIQLEVAEDGSSLLIDLAPPAGLDDAVDMIRAELRGRE